MLYFGCIVLQLFSPDLKHFVRLQSSRLAQFLFSQRQVPALKNVGGPLGEALHAVYPVNVDLSYETLSRLKNTTFILAGEFYKKDRLSCFKGTCRSLT